MPAYNNSAFAPNVGVMTSGLSAYCFGSFNDRVSSTKMTVSNVALTSNVATLTVQVLEGNIPTAGQVLSVQGTQTNSGLFNVTAVVLTGATINATTGAGTVTFALTHANVSSTADTGMAIAEQVEASESLANGSSVQWASPVELPRLDQGRSIKAVVSFPSIPTAATVVLQEAAFDQDSEYTSSGTVASVAASTVTGGQLVITATPGRFYRLNVSGLSGSGSIIGKLLC